MFIIAEPLAPAAGRQAVGYKASSGCPALVRRVPLRPSKCAACTCPASPLRASSRAMMSQMRLTYPGISVVAPICPTNPGSPGGQNFNRRYFSAVVESTQVRNYYPNTTQNRSASLKALKAHVCERCSRSRYCPEPHETLLGRTRPTGFSAERPARGRGS